VKQKRHSEVGPHRIAQEVRQMQVIPLRTPDMISERASWFLSLRDDRSITPLDPCALGRVDPAVVRVAAAQKLEDGVRVSMVTVGW
jgi:hypothetical protein